MNHVRHHHGSAHALTGTGVGAAGDLQRRAAGDAVDGRERPEELEPGPEPRDVVGGAGEQGPRGRLLRAGHQPPQLPHLPPQRRAGRARRRPPPLALPRGRLRRLISSITRASAARGSEWGDEEAVMAAP